MNPDDDNYEEPEEPNLLACPECEGTQWRRWERGRFTQTHRLDTDRLYNDETDNEDMEVDEEDTWDCCQCGTTASPDADDAITDWLNNN
jgi:hypothetical protein